jgi:hypothetical protein
MSICELTHIIAKPVNVQVNVWTRFARGLIRLARFAQRESLGPIPLARFALLDSLGPIRQGSDSPGPMHLESFAFAAAAAAIAATVAAAAAAAALPLPSRAGRRTLTLYTFSNACTLATT